MTEIQKIKSEILEFSYWEHFKLAKDLALIFGPNHPRRKRIEAHMNEILLEIHTIKNAPDNK